MEKKKIVKIYANENKISKLRHSYDFLGEFQ